MKVLYPFELIYQTVTGIKNLMYENKIFSSVTLDTPVVSVGNLSFGGVGKTPCIAFIANELKKDLRISIVTKSYKTALKGPRAVDLSLTNAADTFGDEACLLQELLPECRIWSGPVKAETAVASQLDSPDLILVDDGFSHRQLRRNFDLVLIDATQGMGTYMREPKSSLHRAHAVLLTKANMADRESIEKIRSDIQSQFTHLGDAVFLADSVSEISLSKGTPVVVFCGLGRPESLISSLQVQGYRVVDKLTYADHFRYCEEDEEYILNYFLKKKEAHNELELVTTAKDFVKLKSRQLRSTVHVVDHKITMNEAEKEALFEKIRKSF